MKTLLLTWVLVCGGDAGLTSYALTHGGQELMLPSQDPRVVSVMVGGQAAVGALAIHQLDRQGHSRWARIVGWTLVVARGAAISWNVAQIAKMR